MESDKYDNYDDDYDDTFDEDIEEIQFSATIKEFPTAWYAIFFLMTDNAIDFEASLSYLIGLCKESCEREGVDFPFDSSDYLVEEGESFGITTIVITAPHVTYATHYVNRIYMTYTETEDAYDCPQIYFTESFSYAPTTRLYLVDYTGNIEKIHEFEGDEEEEYNHVINAYMKYASILRGRELSIKRFFKYLELFKKRRDGDDI